MGRIIFKLTESNEIEVLDSDYGEQDFKIISVENGSTTIRLSTIEEDLDQNEDIE